MANALTEMPRSNVAGESAAEINGMEFHPAAMLFPMMSGEDLAALAEDIKQNGLRDAIVMFDAKVLDGRNRLSACVLAGVQIRTEVLTYCPSPSQYVLSKNLHRRHLTESQRMAVGVDVMPMQREEARLRQAEGQRRGGGDHRLVVNLPPSGISIVSSDGPSVNPQSGKSREIVGQLLGVSGAMIQRAIKVKETSPELFEEIRGGTKTVTAAYREITEQPKNKRDAILDNAAKRRFENLQSVLTTCEVIAGLDFKRVLETLSATERKTWLGITLKTITQLRIVARNLQNGVSK